MSIRFNTELLMRDFEATVRRKRITLNRAAQRCEVHLSTMNGIKSGNIRDITVTTLARMLDFMDVTDIEKYIYEEN